MIQKFSFIALFNLFLIFFAHQIIAEEFVTVSVSRLDTNTIKVVYQPPVGIHSLQLWAVYKERTSEVRKKWLPLDDCGSLSDSGLVAIKSGCAAASFSIPIEASMMDQVYPTAYPFGERGVLLHTGALAVSDACCNTMWNFDAGKGEIIIDGKNLGHKASIAYAPGNGISFTGVFLGAEPKLKNSKVIATETSPAWLVDGVTKSASEISRYYKKTYPKLKFSQPALFISNIVDSNQSSFQADVSSHKMIRFGFVNASEKPDENYIASIKNLTSHEFAHLLQPNKGSASYIHEGGAEFVRWLAQYKVGWRDKAALGKEFSDSLFTCLNAAGNKNWKDFEKENLQLGMEIYRCGLAVHIIALASRQNLENAEENIHRHYQRWTNNATSDFAQDIECGKLKNCKPVWLSSLESSNTSFAEQVDHQLNQLGIVKDRRYTYDKKSMHEISGKAFASLVDEDCGGYNFWTKENYFYLDELPSTCNSLKNGLSITGVNGVSYFSKAIAAIETQNEGCQKNHFVTLNTVEGKDIKVACTKEFIPSKNYYEFDIDKLLVLLGRKKE